MIKRIKAFFQIDPLHSLNKDTDSSISIIKKALETNVEVWVGSPANLTLNGKTAIVSGQNVLNINLELGKKKKFRVKKKWY